MTEYWTDFAQESSEQITALNNELLTLERSPDDEEALDRIFRIAHTLKGNCGAMGFSRASDLAHAIEDLLAAVRSGRVAVTPELMDAIFDAIDDLESMIDEARETGEITTDPSPTIEALREHVDDLSHPASIARPGEDEIDSILARFEPPEREHDSYLVRLSINREEAINNGKLVVDALADAFELIGTDPSREAIDNDEYGGSFDAVFASAVGETAITAALEPIEAVNDFEIVRVTGRFETVDRGVPLTPDEASDISSDEAQDLGVDELLDEFEEFDDLDSLVEEVENDEDLSAFDEMGDAGSFDDLLEDESVDEELETSAGDSAESEEEEHIDDANTVFAELKGEVEMVGFDELQDELDDLEFEEFDSDDEVGMDELLGDEYDAKDDTFLDTETSSSQGDTPVVGVNEEADLDDSIADEPEQWLGREQSDEHEDATERGGETDPFDGSVSIETSDLESDPDASEAQSIDEDGPTSTAADEPFGDIDLDLDVDGSGVDESGTESPSTDEFDPFANAGASTVGDDETEPSIEAETSSEAGTSREEIEALGDIDFGPEDEGLDLTEPMTSDTTTEDHDASAPFDTEPDDAMEPDDATEDVAFDFGQPTEVSDDPDAIGSLDQTDGSDSTQAGSDDVGEAEGDALSETDDTDPSPDEDGTRALSEDDPVSAASVPDRSQAKPSETEADGTDFASEETPSERRDGADSDETSDPSFEPPSSTFDSSADADPEGWAQEGLEAPDEVDDVPIGDAAAFSNADDDGSNGFTRPDSVDTTEFAAVDDDALPGSDEFEASDSPSEDAFDTDETAIDTEFDVDEIEVDTGFDVDETAADTGFDVDETEADAGFDLSVDDNDDLDSSGFEADTADVIGAETGDAGSNSGEFSVVPSDGNDETRRIVTDSPSFEMPEWSVPDPDDRTALDSDDSVQSIRVDIEQVDTLLNLVEGLVTSRGRLRHAIEAERDIDSAAVELEEVTQITSALQETVMDVRLVPLRTVTDRLPRTVRDIAREQDKLVSFEQSGADVELDRRVLDRMGDPLIHLVRNAVDHGIEPPDEREANEKDEEGSVELRAERSRDSVWIEVEDDGRGLNPDRLRKAAVEAGAMSPEEADALTEEGAYELIFHPGLSTAEEVTDVSGRGVGMDVVKRTIDDLDGTVSIDSTPGDGTTVRMSLPVSVAIDDILFVETDGQEFGIPLQSVLDIESGSKLETDAGEVSLPGNDEIEIVDLGRELDVSDGEPNGDGMLVRIREDVRPIALHCDEVTGQQEVVVKPFEGFMSDIPGFSGVTVRGRGEVVNILDVNTL